jgi:hypothetical protein
MTDLVPEGTPGTEVTVKGFPALDQLPETVQNLLKRLALNSTMDDRSSAQFAIMDAILKATSLDELLKAADAGTLSGQDYTGKPFLLHSDNVEWHRSATNYIGDGGFPYYALLRVRDFTTQNEVVLSCGGFGFVASLETMLRLGIIQGYDEQGGMPLQLRAKPTASGYSVLILEPAPVVNTVRASVS